MKSDLAILDYFKKKYSPICTVIVVGYSEDRNELAKTHSIIFNAAHRVYCASSLNVMFLNSEKLCNHHHLFAHQRSHLSLSLEHLFQ